MLGCIHIGHLGIPTKCRARTRNSVFVSRSAIAERAVPIVKELVKKNLYLALMSYQSTPLHIKGSLQPAFTYATSDGMREQRAPTQQLQEELSHRLMPSLLLFGSNLYDSISSSSDSDSGFFFCDLFARCSNWYG